MISYRKEIDGLRAIAVIPVVFFHAGISSFSGGYVGVDVFFVISGYLITSLIVAEKEKDEFSIINFYLYSKYTLKSSIIINKYKLVNRLFAHTFKNMLYSIILESHVKEKYIQYL